jgi:hypothetical protein
VIALEATMKIFVLLLSMVLVSVAAAADTNGLRFFYCIHAEHSCNETAGEVPVKNGNASLLARRALSTKDDFVGFIDAQQTTLQFYVEDADSILVDMPYPKQKGSYATHLNRAQALRLIVRLSPPLARYRTELKLEFAQW